MHTQGPRHFATQLMRTVSALEMAYDETLAQRIREMLRTKRSVSERKMFGGIAFMLRGHMFIGVLERSLMARVGPENYERALASVGVRKMDFTGKPMRGYVYVGPRALKSAAALRRWVDLCAEFVAGLPAKHS
jgi:TfoX/Sxy family transcriptional regulator of competence genes